MHLLRMTLLAIAATGLWSTPVQADNAAAVVDYKAPQYGIIDPNLLSIGYSGKEDLLYDVSWTGGIKIGELHLQITSLPDTEDEYEIRATVTTKNSAIDRIYPIKDVHVTRVRGPKRLPYHYEIWQKEGRNYQAHRVTEFNQETYEITETKNDKLDKVYQVDGETNNEFSSFFNSRLMDFPLGGGFIVPTFADKKRVEVVVNAITVKHFDETLIGPVSTVEIMPIMNFKGLYDKKGDTVIWYTNDECRVPVMINSKIIIGSLTAELTAYENPACLRYPAAEKKKK